MWREQSEGGAGRAADEVRRAVVSVMARNSGVSPKDMEELLEGSRQGNQSCEMTYA